MALGLLGVLSVEPAGGCVLVWKFIWHFEGEFGVTLAEVSIICPDHGWGRDTLTKNRASERSLVYIQCTLIYPIYKQVIAHLLTIY